MKNTTIELRMGETYEESKFIGLYDSENEAMAILFHKINEQFGLKGVPYCRLWTKDEVTNVDFGSHTTFGYLKEIKVTDEQ